MYMWGQRSTYKSWFSPSIVWVLGTKVRWSGLVAKAFSGWALSLDLERLSFTPVLCGPQGSYIMKYNVSRALEGKHAGKRETTLTAHTRTPGLQSTGSLRIISFDLHWRLVFISWRGFNEALEDAEAPRNNPQSHCRWPCFAHLLTAALFATA